MATASLIGRRSPQRPRPLSGRPLMMSSATGAISGEEICRHDTKGRSDQKGRQCKNTRGMGWSTLSARVTAVQGALRDHDTATRIPLGSPLAPTTGWSGVARVR